MDTKKNELLEALLVVEEVKLKAQLMAVRKLSKPKSKEKTLKPKRMSQIDMVHNILLSEDKPLHITAIIEKVKSEYNVELDRETIVSSISKKVKRNKQFIRTDKNTFTLIKSEEET